MIMAPCCNYFPSPLTLQCLNGLTDCTTFGPRLQRIPAERPEWTAVFNWLFVGALKGLLFPTSLHASQSPLCLGAP